MGRVVQGPDVTKDAYGGETSSVRIVRYGGRSLMNHEVRRNDNTADVPFRMTDELNEEQKVLNFSDQIQ